MGSSERSKRRSQLWQKAVVHFILCFGMGFFTGFAPTSKPSIFITTNLHVLVSNRFELSPQPLEPSIDKSAVSAVPARSKESARDRLMEEKENNEEELIPRKLLIIITPTSTKHRSQQTMFLRRLAYTLRMVPPPLLWIVIEGQSDSSEVSEMLRKTGIMYRHLVFEEVFRDPEVEMNHQKNIALNHIEHHRLSGIAHFAGLSNVYSLRLFDEIRSIEVFGTWQMASLSANRKRVVVEGPVCDSSQVIGWHLRKTNNQTETISPFHISSFAFNSSILWDPERWGRPSFNQDNAQNSIKFVRQVVLEDDTKLKGIPEEGCSKIMIWHLHFQARINHLRVSLKGDNK